MTWEYCVPVATFPVAHLPPAQLPLQQLLLVTQAAPAEAHVVQSWMAPLGSLSWPAHTPVSVTPVAPVRVKQTPGTLITAWSPWLEQNRLVVSGMLLSGPAHA